MCNNQQLYERALLFKEHLSALPSEFEGLLNQFQESIISLSRDLAFKEINASQISPYKSGMKILKSGQSVKDAWGKAHVCENFVEIMDSARCIRFYQSTAPKFPTHSEDYTEFPDTSRIFQEPSYYRHRLVTPELTEVKAKISEIRAKNKLGQKLPMLWTFRYGDSVVTVNAEYLVSMLECLPHSHIRVGNPRAGIFFQSNLGVGLLLPVRLPKGGTNDS